ALVAWAERGEPRVPLLRRGVVRSDDLLAEVLLARGHEHRAGPPVAGDLLAAARVEVLVPVQVDALETAEIHGIRRAGPGGAEDVRVREREPQRRPPARRMAAQEPRRRCR